MSALRDDSPHTSGEQPGNAPGFSPDTHFSGAWQGRPEQDETVIEAIGEGRHAEDIYLVQCPWCEWWSYYNEGSHASCRNPKHFGRNLTAQIAETITLADYWADAPYPCDEQFEARTHKPDTQGSAEKSANT